MVSLKLVLISLLASFTAGVYHGGGLTLHKTHVNCQVSTELKSSMMTFFQTCRVQVII